MNSFTISPSTVVRSLLGYVNAGQAIGVFKNAVDLAGGLVSDVAQAGATLRQLVAGRLHSSVEVDDAVKPPDVQTPDAMREEGEGAGSKYERVKAKWRAFIFEGSGAKFPQSVQREDIKGIAPTLEDLDDIIDYLRYYRELSQFDPAPEPPAGILMAGNPGTGKTYTSNYIATVSKAHFINVGDFLESGDKGLSKLDVRALFEVAGEYVQERKQGVIIFWDEFHKFVRDTSLRRQEALKELMEQMSGLQARPSGVLIIATAHVVSDIPEEFRRDGRFGLSFSFFPPSRKGLITLLKYYVERLPVEGTFDYDTFARLIGQGTIAPTVYERAKAAYRKTCLRAVAKGESEARITPEDLKQVLLRHLVGLPQEESRTADEIHICAVHEMGHAVLGRKLGLPIPAVTILEIGNSLARTIYDISESRILSLQMRLDLIALRYGGLAAEAVCGIESNQGIRNDLEEASNRATFLVEEFGMIGGDLLSIKGLHAGRRIGMMDHQNMSPDLLKESETAIRRIVEEQWQRAKDILEELGRARLEWLATQLIERTTILQTDIDKLIEEAEKSIKPDKAGKDKK